MTDSLPKMTVIETGATQGAWLETPDATYALVVQAGQPPYVAIYRKDDNGKHVYKLPHALSINTDGDMTLQMPVHGEEMPDIVPMFEVGSALRTLNEIRYHLAVHDLDTGNFDDDDELEEDEDEDEDEEPDPETAAKEDEASIDKR